MKALLSHPLPKVSCCALATALATATSSEPQADAPSLPQLQADAPPLPQPQADAPPLPPPSEEPSLKRGRSESDPVGVENSKARRKRARAAEKQRQRRRKHQVKPAIDYHTQDYRPPLVALRKYTSPVQKEVDVCPSKLPAAKGAYVGAGKAKAPGGDLGPKSLEELEKSGIEIIPFSQE